MKRKEVEDFFDKLGFKNSGEVLCPLTLMKYHTCIPLN